MTEHKTKLKYGEGKVEFLACLEEIKELHQAGHCGKVIYRQLANTGDISMSYRSFHKYFSQLPGHTKRGALPPLREEIPIPRTGNAPSTFSKTKTNSLAVTKEKINLPVKVPENIKVPVSDGFHFNPIPKQEELI